MGGLETSRKGIEGTKQEHDEGLIDNTIQQDDSFYDEEKLSFEEKLQRLSKSKEEILREDAERAKKRAKERAEELEESNKILEDSKEELKATIKSIEDIFG